tara:strand:- start:253 stop:483 length:231 start_codon:yes stop_codon:yes gene_type:complete
VIKPKEEKEARGIEIDLSGPEGNAYVLLAYAERFCRQLGYDDFKRECVLSEMRLTDYEGLLYTFDREFGSFVTLWR